MEPAKIPQRVIDRVLSRRGRLHPYESLDGSMHGAPGGGPAGSLRARGQLVRDSARKGDRAKVNRLADALRARGGHVVWMISTYGPEEDRNWANLDTILGEEAAAVFRAGLSEGADGHAIWPALDLRDTDPVVRKNR